MNAQRTHFSKVSLALLFILLLPGQLLAQESPSTAGNESLAGDGSGRIVIDLNGTQHEPPLFYSANTRATATITASEVTQAITVAARVLQGKPRSLSLQLFGNGEIVDATGEHLRAWSIRREGDERFFDFSIADGQENVTIKLTARTPISQLPKDLELLTFGPANAVGFDSVLEIKYSAGVNGKLTRVEGYSIVSSTNQTQQLRSASGGAIAVALSRSSAVPQPIEITNANVTGQVDENGTSIRFSFDATAEVSEANAELLILSGNVAVSELPEEQPFRLRLGSGDDKANYYIQFAETGSFPIVLEFVAPIELNTDGLRHTSFQISTSTIASLQLTGIDEENEFGVIPGVTLLSRTAGDAWSGFIPANGEVRLQWRPTRQTGEGKLFFTTSGQIETQVGPGLLRQQHTIDYQILQGELEQLQLDISGPGELLDVQGDHVLGWNLTEVEGGRRLDVKLSQPLTGAGQLRVRTQTPVGAFPVRIEGMRLRPIGTIRHAGYVRITNSGLVRLEPTNLTGLTQLAPEQFPGEAVEARQTFVYRFPTADYSFTVIADRVQPEISISQIAIYSATETERTIYTEVELDIREAPIRQYELEVPGDYSVVAVSGAGVADYIVASETSDAGMRTLTVIYAQDVSGRQLVSMLLEKSEAIAAGDWQLSPLRFPQAKSVQGDIGVVGAAGIRIVSGNTQALSEKPIAYFPKPTAGLQQSYRMREQEWSATMQIELLERSVQSDLFHLYSLSKETVYGSALINFFVTGAPIAELNITVPQILGNVTVDGQDIRTWRRDGDNLIVSLHQPVMGAYTLLITFEQKPDESTGVFSVGQVQPTQVQSERGYIHVVSPLQVELNTSVVSEEILKLNALELPAEFRLLSNAPSLGTWQYTERPFQLDLQVNWFQSGSTANQVVEFAEANSRVSKDGELVTDVVYYVKSRGQQALEIILPGDPVRLWEVVVNGQSVSARRAGDSTLIPLPAGADPNVPVEVRLRLGKPSLKELQPELTLPVIAVPVLKTQWNIAGDEKQVLIPIGGTVNPPLPVIRPSGFEWTGRQAIIALGLITILAVLGVWAIRRSLVWKLAGIICLLAAAGISAQTAAIAADEIGPTLPLQLSLPVLSAAEQVQLNLQIVPAWQANVSWTGIGVICVGLAIAVLAFIFRSQGAKRLLRGIAFLTVSTGILMQPGGAAIFFGLVAAVIVLFLVLPLLWSFLRKMFTWIKQLCVRVLKRRSETVAVHQTPGATAAPMIGWIVFALATSFGATNVCAQELLTADSITQQWKVTKEDGKLSATATASLIGKPGDQFLLLKSPAVLTQISAEGVRISKQATPDGSVAYIAVIPTSPASDAESADATVEYSAKEYKLEFSYELASHNFMTGIPVLTGKAAIQKIDVIYDETGWEIKCPTAVRVDSVPNETATQATLLLGAKSAIVSLAPKSRDTSTEETHFYVETSNLYIPSPGVVDGVHRIQIRVSQGEVSQLTASVPSGLTVSNVTGPVTDWQFDAENRQLKMAIEPAQTESFQVLIETQSGLESLPFDLQLNPLRIDGADGEVGSLAIGFGPDAQPEGVDAKDMSEVNQGDFDSSLLENKGAVLYRVYRYGEDGGSVSVRVGQVSPEIRLNSQQVVSLGDERLVMAIEFAVEISRAGVFQLSFPLPAGLEVESLSGSALHHWAELTENDTRQIVLHLNGKTIGTHAFNLTLVGNAPSTETNWDVPRFELNNADRQMGRLVINPITGLRLRTVSRQNVSEMDPRSMGGEGQGSLAFRLLQRDWDLELEIEQLAPWITGQILQDVVLREGQTKTTAAIQVNVRNASIRTLEVELPLTDEEAIKTLRATGEAVSDFVRTSPDSNVWQVQFQRRIIGSVTFQIEYERRGEQSGTIQSVTSLSLPEARQTTRYVAVRAGGRLELSLPESTQRWQQIDWHTVPSMLREATNRNAPSFALRAEDVKAALSVQATRHDLASALKLRIASGELTTVLSPTGDQLTAVDVVVDVIQRSSLSVGLPKGAKLFSIFVNGESVNSIHQQGNSDTWQFYILPGLDGRTASVRFVYSTTGEQLDRVELVSPEMNVPLENIRWSVLAPKGYKLLDSEGNLELVDEQVHGDYDRESYLNKLRSKLQSQAQQASQLLDQANRFLQAGDQSKANWAFNSVANRYALDAASNEDARVQLENLQTQQAIVGLNTRRQRLYLNNDIVGVNDQQVEQLKEAAMGNQVLQGDDINFQPQQISQLLRGNTNEDNAALQQLAMRLVQHQHATEPAPQAIVISLPEEGTVYTFSRTVQVLENSTLELALDFGLVHRLEQWRAAIIAGCVLLLGLSFIVYTKVG